MIIELKNLLNGNFINYWKITWHLKYCSCFCTIGKCKCQESSKYYVKTTYAYFLWNIVHDWLEVPLSSFTQKL